MHPRLTSLLDGQARGPTLAVAFAAGVLAASGQAPFNIWPLALSALAALIALVLPAQSPGKAARIAWLGGAGYFAAALIWIVQPFLVDIPRHGWMAPFALALMGFGMALFWAGASYAATWLATGRMARAFALVVTLTFAEMLRSYVFTGFPWALIGHLWISTPVMQLASWIGPHGLSLVALLTVALPLVLGWRGAVAALCVVAGSWGLGAAQLAKTMPERPDAPIVRLLQPNAPQHLKWRDDMIRVFFERQLEFTAQPSAKKPDLIVWPETAVPYLLNNAEPVLKMMSEAAGGTPVVSGILRRDRGALLNSLVVIGPDGGIDDLYDKHHLVPFGEFIPLGDLFARMGIYGLAANSSGFGAGTGAAVLDLGKLGIVLPLICYEAIFPHDVNAPPERPDWVLQITNDAWFGTFSGPYQHLAQARLRAVEQGLPVLRSANTGVSAVINARGRVLSELPLNTAGQLTVAVPAALAPTVYSRTGDWPALIILIVALAALVTQRRKNSR
ncbi:apolipoprotein N-acyltransferase [Actibacterium lipolyticum]|uniref:Apolipoprotein N-acyltransferase n=1 Tax=Actibacterium lipolyticum TaxID=1524263 RepID=A0A238KR00_9RHOB|nr:apolipoprotein N-acyltransferase [Actibacterium lipolyticum]SMX44562.1 Apolipoprotein N-acyltransferase [Actibacterium lipolyticum]